MKNYNKIPHSVSWMFLFLLVFSTLQAQSPSEKAALFTYDRIQLNEIMEQINEGTVSTGSAFSAVPDSTRSKLVIDTGFVLIGAVTGCATIVLFTAFWSTYGTAGKVVRFIAGGLIGLVAPMAYVKWATHDRFYSRLTGIGSIAGMACISIAPTLLYLIGGAF